MKNTYLISFLTMMLPIIAYADSTQMSEKMKMMQHITPMPGLMMVVTHHSDELSLSNEQTEALAQWRNKSSVEMAKMAQSIIADEKNILEATLTGKSKESIQKLTHDMLEKRKAVINRKLACRDNMQNILDEKQWNKVVTLYRQEKM